MYKAYSSTWSVVATSKYWVKICRAGKFFTSLFLYSLLYFIFLPREFILMWSRAFCIITVETLPKGKGAVGHCIIFTYPFRHHTELFIFSSKWTVSFALELSYDKEKHFSLQCTVFICIHSCRDLIKTFLYKTRFIL